MDKKISTGVGSVILVVFFLAALLVISQAVKTVGEYQKNILPQNQHKVIPSDKDPINKETGGPERGCLKSGGTIVSGSCCKMTDDFPNNCAIGACGCAPTNSHEVKTCECGEGKCFDGSKCIESDFSPPENKKGGVMCPMDAKLCPDGTSVGRTGPNCEFAPCP